MILRCHTEAAGHDAGGAHAFLIPLHLFIAAMPLIPLTFVAAIFFFRRHAFFFLSCFRFCDRDICYAVLPHICAAFLLRWPLIIAADDDADIC